MGGNACAEGRLTLGIAVLEQVWIRQLLLVEAAPYFVREQGEIIA